MSLKNASIVKKFKANSRNKLSIVNKAVDAKPNPKGMDIQDFLYAFSISYGMYVDFCSKHSTETELSRQEYLVAWCAVKLDNHELAAQAYVTAKKIVENPTRTVIVDGGKVVSSAMLTFDTWFNLIIGKQHQTVNCLDLSDEYMDGVTEDIKKCLVKTTNK